MSLENIEPGSIDESGFERRLGWFSSTSIVIGAIIGVGIFFTPKVVAQTAGSTSAAMMAWCIGGGIAVLGALVFAELGGAYARTGGQYQVLRDAYGPLPGFIYVFCNSTAIQAGAVAIIASISANYLIIFFTGADASATLATWLGIGLICCLMATNYLGVQWGALMQNVTVVSKVATLLIVVLLAILFSARAPNGVMADVSSASSGEIAPAAGGTSTGTPVILLVFSALVSTLFSFGGWQHALWIGGEVRNPKRNVPLAIILGVAVVTFCYISFNWALFQLLGYDALSTSRTPASDAVAVVWPALGNRLVAGAIAISGIGVLNAQLLSGPRLLCGMARDGKFFSIFSQLHATFRSPFASIFLIGGIGVALLGLAGSDAVDFLLNGVVMVDTVLFIATALALIVLKSRRRDIEWPIRIPFYPLAPILFVIAESAVFVGAFVLAENRFTAFIGLGWIAMAALTYFVFFRSRSPVSPEGSASV